MIWALAQDTIPKGFAGYGLRGMGLDQARCDGPFTQALDATNTPPAIPDVPTLWQSGAKAATHLGRHWTAANGTHIFERPSNCGMTWRDCPTSCAKLCFHSTNKAGSTRAAWPTAQALARAVSDVRQFCA